MLAIWMCDDRHHLAQPHVTSPWMIWQ